MRFREVEKILLNDAYAFEKFPKVSGGNRQLKASEEG